MVCLEKLWWLDEMRAGEHFRPMSTLEEIKSAVANLPQHEQWSLLEWLQSRLAAIAESDAESRFRAMAARGSAKKGLALLDKLDAAFGR